MKRPRDLPRMAAPILFGVYDVTVMGVARITDLNVRAPQFTQLPGSLSMWGWMFLTVGVLIWAGAFSRRMAWVSAFLALALWLYWAHFIWQARTHHPGVVPMSAPAGALGLAVLHTLLVPYRRNKRRLDGSRPS